MVSSKILYNVGEQVSNANDKDVRNNNIPLDKDNVHKIFGKIRIDTNCIKSFKRVGNRSSQSNARPRPVEVELNNEFDRRKIMANVGLLKGSKLLIKPKLLWRDTLIEKSLLDIRYKLIQHGLSKTLFKIRDLKLFYNDEEVATALPLDQLVSSLTTSEARANLQ